MRNYYLLIFIIKLFHKLMRNYYLLKLLLDEFVIIRGVITMMSKNYEKLLFAKIIIG